MTKSLSEKSIEQNLLEAEQAGLRFAIKGRTVLLVLIGAFFILSRWGIEGRALAFMAMFGLFILIGLLHYRVIGTSWDRRWIKYLVMTIDVGVLCYLVATLPMFEGLDFPQSITFRNTNFPFFFVFLAVAAFSFSPWFVLYTGTLISAGWISAFLWTTQDMPVMYGWRDVLANYTKEDVERIFFSPYFAAGGSRFQECVALMSVAVLVSLVMWRARHVVKRQIELDDERRVISDVFGQYVPKNVADSLIHDRGLLEPVERVATAFFLDVEGFTKLTEASGPTKTVRVLNSFFDEVTQKITEQGGVVTQFQGDAVMATFNLPAEDPDHALHALQAAIAIRELVEQQEFDGVRLGVRIGIATGPVLAGSVGGGGRLTYTAYGDTVNLAARLEAMNKELGTRVLIANLDPKTSLSGDLVSVGSLDVRGLTEPVQVHSIEQNS